MDFTFITSHWETILLVAIALNTFLKALRDAIDKTPETDDNMLERIWSIVTKALGYLVLAKRPK